MNVFEPDFKVHNKWPHITPLKQFLALKRLLRPTFDAPGVGVEAGVGVLFVEGRGVGAVQFGVGDVGLPDELLRGGAEVLARPHHVALPQGKGLNEQFGGLGDVLHRHLWAGESPEATNLLYGTHKIIFKNILTPWIFHYQGIYIKLFKDYFLMISIICSL